ncbi:MAG: glycosyltransferase family 2 protein [Prevotella sp.]|nr:glycosyltransferase family 2 protein [Prevotella sp.]
MKKITILVPCHNEEASLPLLYDELRRLMDSQTGYVWQVLLIDDGSSDGTLRLMRDLRRTDVRICYVSLSRNFGKESAMLAGFDNASGDCLVIIDADLQHPPSLIPDMIRLWEEGYEDVYARRVTRGREPWWRRRLSLAYYKLLQRMTDVEVLENVGDFRLLDRKCVEALRTMRETQRYTKGMFCWMGFRKKEIVFEQQDRAAGTSSWNLLKLINLAVDGITSFTVAPLRISTMLGLAVSVAAIAYSIYFFVKTLLYGDPVQGFPTLIIVVLFLGGMQLFSLGIIGEYLGRIFNETKNRPVYLITEKEGV